MTAADPSSDSGTTLPEGPTIPAGFLMREQRRSWNAGKRIFLEDYFARYPDWQPPAEELLDLIWHEILIREGRGETPTLGEYLRRFPALAEELRLHFEVHEALSAAGVPNDATECLDGLAPAEERPAPATPPAWSTESASERYVASAEIARGGMGAVLRARDRKIQREVAVKYLLDQADAGKKARFIAEAQITGQLEHPNIVPLHDLGIDAHQRLFFAMKMVRGRSLAEILESLRIRPELALKEWPLVRFLNSFLGVCNALAYAHSRGVIHRDVKPSNIMLGEFGEVYLMDWGLAKAAGSDLSQSADAESPTATAAAAEPPVATGPECDGDLTRDGTIVGTLAYMSPEQALGEVGKIDARSDIYSLGAILYEILALFPHVDKTEGELATLHQVSSGQFPTPEQRHPQRARAGLIPRELSAITMKALARTRGERYQNVAELKRDIERYQDGRSVSAKEDTVREMAWKLIKRNRAVSITTAIALLLLTGVAIAGYVLIDRARVRAERANDDFRAEKRARREQMAQSLPAYLRAARLAANERSFDDALIQVNTILDNDPTHAEALLLKAQLLTALERFAEAADTFELYAEHSPPDLVVQRLIHHCRQVKSETSFYLVPLADLLQRQKAYPMDDHLYRQAEKYAKSVQDVKELYQKRLEAAWPGTGHRLTYSKDGEFVLDLSELKEIHDLSSLRGMKLGMLNLSNCPRVLDLSPLRDMNLRVLSLSGCRLVTDLSPLASMKLGSLNLSGCTSIRDFSILRSMPIQAIAVQNCKQLQDLSVFGRSELVSLDVSGCEYLRSLEPLRGMPLTKLVLSKCRLVEDLRPLAGMKLHTLELALCDRVRDLKPLEGMPLIRLVLEGTGVNDLSALAGSKTLVSLNLAQCRNVTELGPLRGMPLAKLTLDGCRVSDLGPLRGLPLTALNLRDCTDVRDLSPLAETKLKSIFLPSRSVPAGFAEALRRISTLEEVKVDYEKDGQMTAAEFFTRHANGDFGK